MKKRILIIVVLLIIAIIVILLANINTQKNQSKKDGNEAINKVNEFDRKTTVGDVENSFDKFGKLIFPVDINIPNSTTLENIGSYYSWYNYINPDKTVEIVNYMKNQVDTGNKIFYDIYTDEEKKKDPEKENTGLFFFKGKPNSKFAIVNAGGGFMYVGAMHDSFPHCLELSKKGYNAFALIYRPDAQKACEDLARAIAFINEHSEELQVDTKNYSLWGGSAGARMAAWVGDYGTQAFGEKEYPKPSAVIMQYTGLSEVTGNEPPTYNCVGTNDYIADYKVMQNRIDKIKANGTDAEIEVFEGLPHGFGLGEGTVAEGWINNAISFWERNSKNEFSESKMEYTNAVPSEYFNKAEKQGKVQKIEYQTYDYTKNSKIPITKPAFVYTPYGYDENDKNTKYNVFFFMHGWTGTADEYFFLDNNAVTNILDHMIEDNLIEPTIVVALTFDSENKSQNFGRSTDEIAVYNQELKKDLLPFIDNQYNTYGTRDHRAFGGFSLGAVTTWYQFQYNLDLIKYFIPMSGDSWIVEMYGGRYEPDKTAKQLKEIADNSNFDFFICQTNGTQDAVFSQPDNQMKAMFKLKDTFNSSNLIYLMKQNGRHDFYAMEECTYNGLQKIFK